jgi:polar amino acid transport system substrate-binding protein
MEKQKKHSEKIAHCVLLVEDQPVIQKIHTNYLIRLGYAVNVASNGQEALRLFRLNTYAAVLLDKELPDMDGTDICQAIRQHEKENFLQSTRIIALTTNVLAREVFLSAGCDDFAAKPISLEHLEKLLRQRIPPNQKHKKENKKSSPPDSVFYLALKNFTNQSKRCAVCSF